MLPGTYYATAATTPGAPQLAPGVVTPTNWSPTRMQPEASTSSPPGVYYPHAPGQFDYAHQQQQQQPYAPGSGGPADPQAQYAALQAQLANGAGYTSPPTRLPGAAAGLGGPQQRPPYQQQSYPQGVVMAAYTGDGPPPAPLQPLQPMQPLQHLRPLQPLQPLQPLEPPEPLLAADLSAIAAAATAEAAAAEAFGAPAIPPPPPPPADASASLLAPSASPLLREVVHEGRVYVVDTSSNLVYRDSAAQAGVLERVGKWVQGTLVFVPPLSEQQFFATLRAFLARRKLGLADLFAALDADLDGALAAGSELRALAAHVVPGAAPSEVAYITALVDWDDDGYVSLGELLDADEWAELVADERAEGAASDWVRVLQDTSYVLHTQRRHAQVVFHTLAAEVAAAAGTAWQQPPEPGGAWAGAWPEDDVLGLGGSGGSGGGAWTTQGGGGAGRGQHPHPQRQHQQPVLLEPAQLLRFLRIMRPELGPGEARYVMDHLLQGPGDSRRSLAQVLHTLHLADTAYSADKQQAAQARRMVEQRHAESLAAAAAAEAEKAAAEAQEKATAAGADPAAAAAAGEAAAAAAHAAAASAAAADASRLPNVPDSGMEGAAKLQGPGNSRRRPGSGPGLNQRPPPLGPSRLRRRGGSPRDSVPRFFYRLGYYLRASRLGLRELLAQFDSDGDGGLDPLDTRRLVGEVLPGASSAQIVYIRAAMSSPAAAMLTLQDLARAVQQHDAEVAAGRQDAEALATGAAPTSPLAHLYLYGGGGGAAAAAAAAAANGNAVMTVGGGAESLFLRQQQQQQATAEPADVLTWITEYMARRKVTLATLMAQFDRDGDGGLSEHEAARLVRYVAAGRLGSAAADSSGSGGAGFGAGGVEVLELEAGAGGGGGGSAGGGGSPGAQKRQRRARRAEMTLARFRAEADVDRDGLLSYNDLRMALLAKQDALARDRVRQAAAAGDAAAAAAAAAATTASLLGPAEPALPATLRRPAPPSAGPDGGPDGGPDPNDLPFWAPLPPGMSVAGSTGAGGGGGGGASSSLVGHRTIHVTAVPVGMGQYPGMAPPGTAPEDYDATPYAPARPADARDPFTLAFAAQHPAASALPPSALSVFPSPAVKSAAAAAAAGWGGGGGSPNAVLVPGAMGSPGGGVPRGLLPEVPLADVEPLDPEVTMHSVEYLGHTLMVDRVSNLAFLPLPPDPATTPARLGAGGSGSGALGRPRTAGAPGSSSGPAGAKRVPDEQLHLFGRLLPNGTLERVETPLAAQLFAALDWHLRAGQARLEEVWAAAVMGVRHPRQLPGAPPPPAPPPTDPSGLARFLRPLLPSLTPHQLRYLTALFDLDGDGLVGPDDVVMGFEEIGTTIDTPANKLHATAYKLLARVAGVVLGDYAESYRAFARYQRQAGGGLLGATSGGNAGGGAQPPVSASGSYERVELSMTQLARFLSHLTGHRAPPDDLGAAVVYLATKLAAAEAPGSPAAGAFPASNPTLPGPNQPYGNPYAAGGQLYRHLRDTPPKFDWPFIVGVMRALENSLPVDRRLPSTLSPPDSRRNTRDRLPGSVGGAVGAMAAAGSGVGPPQKPPGGAGWVPGGPPLLLPADVPDGGGVDVLDDEWDAGPAGPTRHAPLRANALTLPPAPHPGRRLIDLRFHVHADGRTFLLDNVTGMLYAANAYILASAAAAADAAAAAAGLPGSGGGRSGAGAALLTSQLQQLQLGAMRGSANAGAGGTGVGLGLGGRAGSGGGGLMLSPRLLGVGVAAYPQGLGPDGLPGAPPPLLLPYPELAGKLTYPDNRLLPAQCGAGVGLVTGALARLAAEEPRVEALYRVLDRDGRGLDHRRLHSLISGVASLTAAEVAFARALLDREGTGRVGLSDLMEAGQAIHYTATEVGAGAGRTPAPPVTLTLGRLEARALDVLHRAAAALATESRLFWLLVTKEEGGAAAGGAGLGLLDRAGAAALLRQLLAPYLPPHEVAVVTAYLAMMTPDKDGNVSADELLQLLRVLPMRLRLPYGGGDAVTAAAAAAGLSPAAVAAAGGVAAAGREVVFAAGFGGPVAADGSLLPAAPPQDGGPGGGSARYRRRLPHAAGPTEAEAEVMYGSNDGAANRWDEYGGPYDPDYGEGRFGRAAAAVATDRRPRPHRRPPPIPPSGGGGAYGLAAEDAAASMYDQDVAELYGPDAPYDVILGSKPPPLDPVRGPQQARRAGSRFLPPRGPPPELDPAVAAVGPASRLPPRSRLPPAPGSFDPYASEEPGLAGLPPPARLRDSAVALSDEADLLDELRGRPKGRLGAGSGLDTSTQYGLLDDDGGVGRAGAAGSQAQPRGRRADDYGGPSSLLDDTPAAAGAGGLSGGSGLPLPAGRPPRAPVGAHAGDFDPYGLGEEAGGLGGDVRASLLPERPTEMRKLGGGGAGGGGGRQAEVLSFLDGGSSGLGKSGSSIGSRSGGLGGGFGVGGGGGGGSGFNPYGDEDVPNAGSAAPSRPMTAATLVRDSSDMPRLASPALESLLPGAGAGAGGGLGGGAAGGSRFGARPPTATRVSGAAGAGGGGLLGDDDDPYGLPAESPPILGRRPSDERGGGAGAGGRGAADRAAAAIGGGDERTTDSASGPALFTSFGDALHEPSAAAAAATAGTGGVPAGSDAGDGFGLFGEDELPAAAAGEGLGPGLAPPSSAFGKPAAAPAASSPAGRSRLAKSVSRNDRAGDDVEDDFGLGSETGLGGGGAGGTAAAAVEPPPGGILNASIRSQAAASDRLGGSIRANRYGGGVGAAGFAGGAGRIGGAESSSGSLGGIGGAKPAAAAAGAAAGGGGFDPYGGDDGDLGAGLPPPTLARSPAASGRKGDDDFDEGLIDYDDTDLAGGEDEF
ncbi:hypothetical protein HYH02_001144 [Chlamydomonas schloesseri]|uniref:EF-hand domain-containing protein n=1 Tax=Chlamydomonas schloesseri TaxID=2026947 RepID=A0A835WUT7_9CHLO|nr:hypothetical protein HYH02_001144 [Chlamydomonas schloesseri]|eukprot:KAG2454105.1 hypothetical protein HYH02_001144 [Chlamydomonas schloesseri]